MHDLPHPKGRIASEQGSDSTVQRGSAKDSHSQNLGIWRMLGGHPLKPKLQQGAL